MRIRPEAHAKAEVGYLIGVYNPADFRASSRSVCGRLLDNKETVRFRTDFRRLAACRGADRPAAQPMWCLPGCSASWHFGQCDSSLPCPRSRPEPRTSGLARQ